jgi:hypothetical protein
MPGLPIRSTSWKLILAPVVSPPVPPFASVGSLLQLENAASEMAVVQTIVIRRFMNRSYCPLLVLVVAQ